MQASELRKKFIQYFKKSGHILIPSSSLIPENDPSVLLTTAGMQQFRDYLAGERDPIIDFGSQKLISIQKCFRTSDIETVGDSTHHTFFEMLGNWSLGNYFKKEAIEYAFVFLIKELGLDQEKLWVTVFEGKDDIPRDEDSMVFWIKQGIPKERIREFGMKDNFWGPAGKIGPCGPSAELHYDLGVDEVPNCKNPDCGPNCACGRYVEIWNLVFMEYLKNNHDNYVKLKQRNVDTGVGFERLLAILNGKKSSYETDLFKWARGYKGLTISDKDPDKKLAFVKAREVRLSRVVADHVRGSVFLIADGVIPARDDRGYTLRRLLRRVIIHGGALKLADNFLEELATRVIEAYQDVYPELRVNRDFILKTIDEENQRFQKTLKKGLKFFNQYVDEVISNKKTGQDPVPSVTGQSILMLDGKEVFNLYETYGFPLELIKELAAEKGWGIDEEGFKIAFKKHQEISRAGATKKFGGADDFGDKVAPEHTATHLLHQALRDVLGGHIKQAGSDLNLERLRFDFTHPNALSKEEIQKVEEVINQKIKDDLPVVKEEMSPEAAIKQGAIGLFNKKYKDKVSVYKVGDYSKEICAGPHVKTTKALVKFKIKKEQSSSRGVRRIKAVVGNEDL